MFLRFYANASPTFPSSFCHVGPRLAHKSIFDQNPTGQVGMGSRGKNKNKKKNPNKIIIRLTSLQPSDRELVKSWLPDAHIAQTHEAGASNRSNYVLSGKLL
jgi:hypothetical protein